MATTEKPIDKRYSKSRMFIEDNLELQGELTKINQKDTDNYPTVYRSSDLYKNLGLTRETLRYYEEIGLIAPERNKDSQYRKFTFADVSHLMSVDFYKKRGFSPLEIRELMKPKETPASMDALNQKISKIKESILEQQQVLKRLEDTKNFYEYAISAAEQFSIREFPLYTVEESFDAVSSLKEYQSKVVHFLNLQYDDILSNMVRAVTFDNTGYKGSAICLIRQVTEKERQTGGTYLESGRCLYTVLNADSSIKL